MYNQQSSGLWGPEGGASFRDVAVAVTALSAVQVDSSGVISGFAALTAATALVHAISTWAPALAAEGRNHSLLMTEIRPIRLQRASVADVVAVLRQQGVRVCLVTDKDDKSRCFALTPTGTTLDVMLGELSAHAPDYAWTQPIGPELIVIHPKSSVMLDWSLPRAKVDWRAFIDVMNVDDPLGLNEHGMVFFYRGLSAPVQRAVEVDLEATTAVEGLNRLVNQMPRMYWTTRMTPRGKRVLEVSSVPLHVVDRQ